MGKLTFFFVRIVAAVVATVAAVTPLYQQNAAQLEKDKAWQIEHLAALKQQKAAGKRSPAREQRFFEGDLAAALKSGMKFNELRVVGTHNSYQNASVPELQKQYSLASRITFGAVPANGGAFQSAPLCDQLDGGIRSLELDVEVMRDGDEVSFVCLHSPVLDMTTHSYDFALALREVKLWSSMHPDHLPITIILEPKVAMLPLQDMDAFTLEHAQTLDALLKRVLGKKLFTPADMLRGYETFADMRKADDWCRVADMRGRVLVLLHPTLVTAGYICRDKTLRTQAMFPMLYAWQAGLKYASFVVENDPAKVEQKRGTLINDQKLIVRTRPDSFGKIDEGKRTTAIRSGAQIVSTDYPPLSGVETPFSFAGGATISDICRTS